MQLGKRGNQTNGAIRQYGITENGRSERADAKRTGWVTEGAGGAKLRTEQLWQSRADSITAGVFPRRLPNRRIRGAAAYINILNFLFFEK